MATTLEQLNRARADLLDAEGLDFLRRFVAYVDLIETDTVISGELSKIRQEVEKADTEHTEQDARWTERLVGLRNRLAKEEPEADDSSLPWPGPYDAFDSESANAFHHYEFTLANFDAVAEDRDEKILNPTDLDSSRAQMLVKILKAKLYDLVFPFNERPAPRPDLMPLWDEMNEIAHEEQNAYRRVERLADENGYFALMRIERSVTHFRPRESKPLKSSDERRDVLEEALKEGPYVRLHDALRPVEARGPLDPEERKALESVEKEIREQVERLHRPLAQRLSLSGEELSDRERKKRKPLSRDEKMTAWIVGLTVLLVILTAALLYLAWRTWIKGS